MANLIIDKNFFDLKEKFQRAEKAAPKKVEKGFNRIGNKIKRDLKSVTPTGATKNLKKSWKSERTIRLSSGYEKRIYNEAPHYHLVERGHRVVPRRATGADGKRQYRVKASTGKKFVQGKFFFEKKMSELEDNIDKAYEEMLDKILEEAFEGW